MTQGTLIHRKGPFKNRHGSIWGINPDRPPCRFHSVLQAPCTRLNPDGWWRRHAVHEWSERAFHSRSSPSLSSSCFRLVGRLANFRKHSTVHTHHQFKGNTRSIGYSSLVPKRIFLWWKSLVRVKTSYWNIASDSYHCHYSRQRMFSNKSSYLFSNFSDGYIFNCNSLALFRSAWNPTPNTLLLIKLTSQLLD